MYFAKLNPAFSRISISEAIGARLNSWCIFFSVAFVIAFGLTSGNAQTTFTNSAPITIVDLDVANPYPSSITVAGTTGNISDVNVRINGLSHTFPDDIGMLLVAPNGAVMVIQSDVGGGTDLVNRTYTLDDQAAAGIPNAGPFPAEGTSARPSSVNDDEFFPPPAPVDCQPAGECPQPAPAGTATLNGIFGGVSANGVWSLYIVDPIEGDMGSISGGWSLIITTAAAAPQQHVVDYNGDGRTDFSVIRGIGTQMRWFNLLNGPGTTTAVDWGLFNLDTQTPGDFDGDNRTDIAVWRPDGPGVAAFYILQSMTLTVRIETFGQTGDIPTVIGDYDGDGRDDPAVYRDGNAANPQSFWFFRGSFNNPAGNITFVPWGTAGDFEAPGDYDGDGRNDFVIQRDGGGGNAQFWKLLTMAGTSVEVFGFSDDTIVPGDYDGDGRTDLALARRTGGAIQWFFRPSNTPGTTVFVGAFGLSTDSTVQGDYDGDGRTDIAVWRPSSNAEQNFFYVLNSSNGAVVVTEWGQCPTDPTCDIAVAEYNSH